jgi:glycosyltransferase involved in cell wall biosynthesis
MILFLGSLTEKKGVRQLIEAMPVVNKSCSGAWLHIYGRDIPIRPSGHSFKALLQEKITELGLTNVTLHEPVPNHEMPGIIESAAVVVLPSHMEAMPLAWLEALAMEKAFIGGNPGPGPEIIEHGKNGLLCNPFDPNDIAAKITQVLMDPKAAAAMGKTAREKIVRYFGSETIAEENDVFFKKLCAVSV